MTLCNLLMEKTKDGKIIRAWEKYDKFSKTPYYEINISKIGSCFVDETIKASKTTDRVRQKWGDVFRIF